MLTLYAAAPLPPRVAHAHQLRCRSVLHFHQVLLVVLVPLWAASATMWPWKADTEQQQEREQRQEQQQWGQRQEQQHEREWQQRREQREQRRERRRRAGLGLVVAQQQRAGTLLAGLYQWVHEMDPLHFFMMWWLLLGTLWVAAKLAAFRSLLAAEEE